MTRLLLLLSLLFSFPLAASEQEAYSIITDAESKSLKSQMDMNYDFVSICNLINQELDSYNKHEDINRYAYIGALISSKPILQDRGSERLSDVVKKWSLIENFWSKDKKALIPYLIVGAHVSRKLFPKSLLSDNKETGFIEKIDAQSQENARIYVKLLGGYVARMYTKCQISPPTLPPLFFKDPPRRKLVRMIDKQGKAVVNKDGMEQYEPEKLSKDQEELFQKSLIEYDSYCKKIVDERNEIIYARMDDICIQKYFSDICNRFEACLQLGWNKSTKEDQDLIVQMLSSWRFDTWQIKRMMKNINNEKFVSDSYKSMVTDYEAANAVNK